MTEDEREFAELTHALFTGEMGKLWLQRLEAETVQLGIYDARSVRAFGAPREESSLAPWRDGQNSIARTIRALMAIVQTGG